MGKSKGSPPGSARKEPRGSVRRSLQRQLDDTRPSRSQPSSPQPQATRILGTPSSSVCSSAETEPYIPADNPQAEPTQTSPKSASPSNSTPICITDAPCKENEVVDLVRSNSQTTLSTNTNTPSVMATMDANMEMLHCKGILHSTLPYDTLRECTTRLDEESDGKTCSNADWVTVGAVLVAVLSNTGIQEDDKDVKLLQQVPSLHLAYAFDKLNGLALHWMSQDSKPQLKPRVLLKRNADDTWCFPNGWYTLDDDENARMHAPHAVVALVEHVTEQTGLQPSYTQIGITLRLSPTPQET